MLAVVTLGTFVWFIVVAIIAAAIVNKTQFTNVHMVWLIPVVWLLLAIALKILGALFVYVVLPLMFIGAIVAVVMYLKKQAT